jgi:hypothetical protein
MRQTMVVDPRLARGLVFIGADADDRQSSITVGFPDLL